MAGHKHARQAKTQNRIQARPVRSFAPDDQRNTSPRAGRAGNSQAFGCSHIVGLALAIIDLRVVHRATLRSLLPKGSRVRSRSDASVMSDRLDRGVSPVRHRNPESEAFQKALKRFEDEGWIARGRDFVMVRNSRALFDWAMSVDWPPEATIDIPAAIAEIERSIRADGSPETVVEQRRQELIRLKVLMEEGFGQNWSGRGSIRFIPRGKLF